MNTPTNKPIEPVKLLPCPFCGGKPSMHFWMDESIHSHDEVQYMEVNCPECEISTHGSEDHSSQFEIWNTRTPLTQSHAEEKEEFRGVRDTEIPLETSADKTIGHGSDVSVQLAPPRSIIKILTSGTTVSEGDKFTHVTIDVYENALNRKCEDLYYANKRINDLQGQLEETHDKLQALQAQNERMREALDRGLNVLCICSGNDNKPNYSHLIDLFKEALTSPPSESIKEGERELSTDDHTYWLETLLHAVEYHVDGHHTDCLCSLCRESKHIRSAMKSEAERK